MILLLYFFTPLEGRFFEQRFHLWNRVKAEFPPEADEPSAQNAL